MWRRVLAVCLLHVAVIPGSGEELTLEEAIGIALEENFTLTTAKLTATFPELQLQVEREAFAWKVQPNIRVERRRDESVEGRARLDADRTFQYGTRFSATAEWVERERGESGALGDIRLEQPLFRRFGRASTLQQVDRAAYQRASSRRILQRESEELVLRVVEAFTAVIYGRELEKQDVAGLTRAEDLLRLVGVRKRQGRATGVEVLEMDLLRRQAELRLTRTQENNVQAIAVLAELLGRVPEQVPPLATVDVEEEAFPGPGESERLAREHRLDLAQALADYAESRRRLGLQRRERYPDVRLLASWQPETSLIEEGWFAGMSAGHDLDLQVTKLEIQREETAVQAALTRVAAVELRISREVREAQSQLRTAEREWELAQDQADLSEERYRLALGLFPSGRVSVKSLRDAEVEWVGAQTQFKDAELERVRVRYRFWNTLGLLLGERE